MASVSVTAKQWGSKSRIERSNCDATIQGRLPHYLERFDRRWVPLRVVTVKMSHHWEEFEEISSITLAVEEQDSRQKYSITGHK